MTTGDGSPPPGDDSPPSREDSPAGEEGPPTCDEAGCPRAAAVRLHVPWSEDRAVCPAHARVLARPDGVVAEPIEGTDAEWP